MSRCSTPDRLIGIGGGGSRVVYRLMQQEWLLEDVMRTEEYDEDNPDTLRASVIDSATNDDFHNSEAAEVRRKVEAAYEDTGFLPEDGFLEFDGPHLISEMIPDRWRGESLTAPPSVRDLCHDQGLTSWWLKEGREPLSTVNDNGFGGGVLRRRSVSKLLFHISEYTDNSVVPNGPDEDEIYIVAALGGGTGSGMILDLASELDGGDTQIHLFGILPHENAGGLEKTNGHAALSELEYAHLTGEGPFDTVTLIPHLEALENDDRDFEMGVVRSILAHCNGVSSDNLTTYIKPTSDIPTNPPRYAPFTFAIPYTVKYDIGVQPEAKRVVGEFLDAKETELKRETQLYDVIEKYLGNSFPDTAKKELAGHGGGTLDTEQGREAAYDLRKRIEEDVRGTMLEDQAFELADLGDLTENLRDSIDSIPNVDPPSSEDGEASHRTETGDPMAEAVTFVEGVPEKIQGRLENSNEFDYKPDDDLYYDLVNVVTKEMENVSTRRDIWKATSTITAEETDLEPDEAELIRTAIRDVLMNPDREYLTDEFENPSIEGMISDWRSQRNALEGTVDDLEAFYETVARDLKRRSNVWNDEVYDEAKTLAAINEHEATVTEGIDDLIREIENAVEQVEGASTKEAVDSVSLDTVGPLDDMNIEGVRPLNDKLEEMGIDTVPMTAIQTGFGLVKDAKRNKLDHGSGILGRTDKSEEFTTNVTQARENGWFEINPTSPNKDVEETFSCRFKSDKLRRESAIETVKEDLIEEIASAFEDAFTEDGRFVIHTFEYSTDMGGTDTKTISLPQGLDRNDIEKRVQKALRASEGTDPTEVLNDTFPTDWIDASDPESGFEAVDDTTVRTLIDAYLRPVSDEHEEVEARVRKLSGGEKNQPIGLVERFELLRGLSTGTVDRDDLELPQANPYKSDEETYGQSFAWNYEGLYGVDFDYEGVSPGQTRSHPYLRQDEAEMEDMAGSPDHIGDTEIFDRKRKKDRIVQWLQNSVDDLFNDEHGRAPIADLSPTSKGNEVKPHYDQTRIVQVYMSRAFDDENQLNQKFPDIRNRFENEMELVNEDMYNAESHSTGDPDEITMVTFIGGIFLDNIELVTKRAGYQDTYERSAASNFIGAHHTIGIGGMWDRWSTMREWVTADGDPYPGSDFGAYVYRDTVRNVDEEFLSEIMIADKDTDTDTDTRNLFLDGDGMLTADAYESTVAITDNAVEADDD